MQTIPHPKKDRDRKTKTSITVRLPKPLDKAIELACVKSETSKQQLIENAVRAYLGKSTAPKLERKKLARAAK
jgi:hypothetical protein